MMFLLIILSSFILAVVGVVVSIFVESAYERFMCSRNQRNGSIEEVELVFREVHDSRPPPIGDL